MKYLPICLCQTISVTEDRQTAPMAGMKVISMLMPPARYVLLTMSSVVQTVGYALSQVSIYLKFYYVATEPCSTFSVLKLES